MSSFEPTDAQKPAIYDRGRDILVSASAGSGKTAVLVNRVIQELIDDDQLNIDQLLLLTFTRAAAKNMRQRIQQQLSADVQDPDFLSGEDPQRRQQVKKHLRSQINRVALADISTIDGFCQQIIKRYYYVIGLDPQYRMSTEAENQLLSDQVYQNLENQGMTGALAEISATEFKALASNFADPQSNVGEGLQDVVQAIYHKANAQAKPDEWLNDLADDYDFSAEQEVTASRYYQETLQPMFQGIINQAISDLKNAKDLTNSLGLDKPAEKMAKELSLLQDVLSQINHGTWDEIKAKADQPIFTRLPSSRGIDPEVKESYEDAKDRRSQAKDAFQDFSKNYFQLDNRQVVKLSQAAGQLVKNLIKLVKVFRQQYQQAKRQRQLLDFSDLEHYAYQILTDESPSGQAVLHDLQQHYREIMLDEYQDTNQLQDEIVARLHNPEYNHVFFVGDVKQSIYRFRQADPTLFLQKDKKFRDPANQEAETVNLAENFRSLKNILDFSNLIFSQIMSPRLGDVRYDEEAALKYKAMWYDPAKDPDKKAPAPTEVLIYDANASEVADDQDEKDLPANNSHENDKQSGELKMVAMRVRQLLDDPAEQIFDADTKSLRRIRPSDIAILERQHGINNDLMQEFNQLNIPIMVHDVKNYFKATEIRIMLSMLRVIDNPYQDIPLVAVLRSPMFAITDPELALIRLADRDHSYYDALQKFLQQDVKPGQTNSYGVDRDALQTKLAAFLDQLKEFQKTAARSSLVDLIWEIYETTGYLDYATAMPNGEQRRANLNALYERAKTYEDNGFRGLYQFVHFIERLQKQDQDLSVAPVEVDNNAVNVLTIHESKGLQFPIVIMVDSNRHFNTKDTSTRASFVLNPHQGQNGRPALGIQYIGPAPSANNEKTDDHTSSLLLKYQLPQYKSTMALQQQAELSEEMRLLYVALTRAEQRLIISGSVNETQRKRGLRLLWQSWQRAYESQETSISADQLLTSHSFLEWIGAALVRTGQIDPAKMGQDDDLPALKGLGSADFKLEVYDAQGVKETIESLNKNAQNSQMQSLGPAGLTPSQQASIKKVIELKYPYSTAEKTTAFQTVSAIRGLFSNQDPDDMQMGRLTFDRQAVRSEGRYQPDDDFAKPRFLVNKTAKPSSAIVGTATHLVFQKLDLHRGQVTIKDIQALINDLSSKKLIAEASIGQAINKAGIAAFYQTDLGQALLAHPDQVYREYPFSMLINGKLLFPGLAKENDGGPILVHGIIDGFLEEADGISLFDYKTDYLSRDNYYLRQELINRYQGQVNLYARALSSWTGKPVKHRYLYFVSTRELYEITGD